MVSVAKAPLVGLQATAECAVKIKESTDSLDKFSKVVSNTFKAAQGLGATSAPVTKLVGQFEAFSGLIGGFNIINRVGDWVCKGKNGDYAWKFWKKTTENRYTDDGYKTGMKVGNEALLTAVHAIDFTRFLGNLGVYDLGAAAAPLALAKSVILLPVSALGIWDAAAKISNANKYVRNTAAKVNKWAERAGLGKAELIQKYTDKKAAAAAKLEGLTQSLTDATDQAKAKINGDIKHIELKDRRWSCYLNELNNLGEDAATLPDNSQFKRDCEIKHKGWSNNLKSAERNAGKEKTKSWLEIAGNIGKIVLGILGIVALIAGFATNPAFIVATAIAWVAIYSLGLAKNLYGMYNPMEQIKKPSIPPLEEVRNNQPNEIIQGPEIDEVDPIEELEIAGGGAGDGADAGDTAGAGAGHDAAGDAAGDAANAATVDGGN